MAENNPEELVQGVLPGMSEAGGRTENIKTATTFPLTYPSEATRSTDWSGGRRKFDDEGVSELTEMHRTFDAIKAKKQAQRVSGITPRVVESWGNVPQKQWKLNDEMIKDIREKVFEKKDLETVK